MNKSHKFLYYSYWLSLICLIHCVSFPVILALLPFINIAFEINHVIELIILGSVLILGSYSLIHAYINHHKNPKPLIIFYIGIALSIFIHFIYHHSHSTEIDWFSFIIEIISGVLIAGAQFYNIKITPKSCTNPNH